MDVHMVPLIFPHDVSSGFNEILREFNIFVHVYCSAERVIHNYYLFRNAHATYLHYDVTISDAVNHIPSTLM